MLDILSGDEGSRPFGFGEFQGALLFHAQDDSAGVEPWISRGTASSTRRLKNLRSDHGASNPTELVSTDSDLLFSATGSDFGRELWAFDGIQDPQVQDLEVGAAGSNPDQLTPVGDAVFFVATTETDGRELFWREAGIVRGFDLEPGKPSSFPAGLTAFQDALLFAAITERQPGPELHLWKARPKSAGPIGPAFKSLFLGPQAGGVLYLAAGRRRGRSRTVEDRRDDGDPP